MTMFSFILFVILSAWIIYDLYATYLYVTEYGYDTAGVLLSFFFAAPMDLFDWIKSKF